MTDGAGTALPLEGDGQAENSEQEMVTVQFFDRRSNKDFDWDIELTRSDYNLYTGIAESLGLSFEEFMVESMANASKEQSTQWSVPIVDEEGNISFEGAEIVDLPMDLDFPGSAA